MYARDNKIKKLEKKETELEKKYQQIKDAYADALARDDHQNMDQLTWETEPIWNKLNQVKKEIAKITKRNLAAI